MYVIYCQNKPKSEFIVAEYDTYFDVSHSLDPFCLHPSMEKKRSFKDEPELRPS